MPLMAAAPGLLASVVLFQWSEGWLDSAFGILALCGAVAAAGGALVWISSERLRRQKADHARRELRLRNQEQGFWAALATSHVGTWQLDPASRELDLSPVARKLHGIAGHAVVDWNAFLAAVHPDDRARVEENLVVARENHASFEIEYRPCASDGAVRWLALRAPARRSAASRMQGICQDVSAHRQFLDELCAAHGAMAQRCDDLAAELSETRQQLVLGRKDASEPLPPVAAVERLRLLKTAGQALAAAPTLADALSVIARTIATTFAWDTAALWGEDKSSGSLRRIQLWREPRSSCAPAPAVADELLTHAWSSNEAQWSQGGASAGGLVRFVIPIQLSREQRSMIEIAGRVLRGTAEEVGLVLGILADQIGMFLREKDAAKKMAEAQGAVQGAARAKSDFLALMSHEIRTPMNGVIGMSNLLLDTALTAKQRDFAQTIRSSADSLLAVINDILDFSKIEAGKLPFERIDFDLRSCVEDTLELMAGNAHAKRLELAAHVHADVPRQVHGDPNRLRQVLNNLVANAIKFTAQGEVIVTVARERTTPQHVLLRFAVRDTGIGIPAEVQKRLFQPFMQADTSTTRRFGGTGLGLAISKQLVELMHGRVGVISEEGKGATFHFTVRLDVAKEATRLDQHPSLPTGHRVLIIDDNAAHGNILVHLLKSWGCRPTRASTAEAGLRHVRESVLAHEPYALAIVDAEMPDTNGLSLAHLIRQTAESAVPKMVLLAAIGQQFDEAELTTAGIGAWLAKPLRESRLRETVSALLAGRTCLSPMAARLPSPAAVPLGVTTAPAGAATRVLLVEDNIINQQVALQQLAKLELSADVATNGVEALAALRRAPYELVLMDCMMPEMDGYEATRRIREVERRRSALGIARPQVYIIALTANAGHEDRARCLAAGMNDFTPKPLRAEDLRRMLKKWRSGPTTTLGPLVSGQTLSPDSEARAAVAIAPGR